MIYDHYSFFSKNCIHTDVLKAQRRKVENITKRFLIFLSDFSIVIHDIIVTIRATFHKLRNCKEKRRNI